MDRHVLSVGVVEDQPLYREMLQRTLATTDGMAVRFAAGSVSAARRALEETPAGHLDALLLDIRLGDGNGLALGREARISRPGLGIVVLSASDVMNQLLGLPVRELKGWGYLSKNSALTSSFLRRTLQAVTGGATVLDPELVSASRPRRGSPLASLTPRQFEVLALIAQGSSNAGIADALHLSLRTAENHVRGLYDALGLLEDSARNARVLAAVMFLENSARD